MHVCRYVCPCQHGLSTWWRDGTEAHAAPMRAQSQGMLSLVNFQIPFPEHTPYRRGKLCAVPTCKRMHLFVVRTGCGSLLGWSGAGLTMRREPLSKGGMTLEAALGLGFRV